ncbi:5-carboxymethyl-2-hydroxymuconate isomerase [Ammoniphilus oxalaticus]|uniref:5-carboxymethyl-2-hydroxymuconate isomerase n=1 Tax=Ammoniphilus oxalaticus TaxID=66863 RepID=A0A419SNJ2_9BACL|nr:fumarylacetoacetate hydrolase family protein [Ammoniphilus oxalaticus]RKD25870.1 5-carboxymethyl-2-hydroxymuconate isomerase [Ammoniphilus oxalaticus]
MKLLQYKQHGKTGLGIWTEKGILNVDLAGHRLNLNVPQTMQQLIERGTQGIEMLKDLLYFADSYPERLFLKEDELEFLPVVDQPEKIICVGLNYEPHAEEAKMEVPDFPVLFTKFNNALAGHKETIQLPDRAKEYDYEAELVIVMGKTAKNVSEKDALSYVYGYSVGNDLSARDLQMRTSQWFLGKSLDQFAPVGPYLVTADEVDPDQLDIQCKVNGSMRQHSNTSKMMFNCAYLVSYISQYMTLKPGDLILTGTPEGVILGYSADRQQWLQAGDVVEVTIEKIGTLRNLLA